MTVKFRDPISAKACIIVSPPFHHCTPSFVPNSPQACRKCKAGSLPAVYLCTGQQRLEIQKEKMATCWEMEQIRNKNVETISLTRAKLEQLSTVLMGIAISSLLGTSSIRYSAATG